MEEIKGFVGYYIDKNANVYSRRPKNGIGGLVEPRLIKQQKMNNGYIMVGLSSGKKGKPVYKSVHRLMAICFLPNPENKKEVNHKNGIKHDNRLENLEWVTRSENIKHAFEMGLIVPNPPKPRYGKDNHNSKLSNQKAIEIRILYEKGNISQRALAKKYNVKQSTIWSILKKLSWQDA